MKKTQKIEIGHGCFRVILDNGEELHLHYANNRGRGNDNCTITRVEQGVERPGQVREYDGLSGVIAQGRTSSWKGHVNFSSRIRRELGLE